jgi:predicted outer membrane repeat protein
LDIIGSGIWGAEPGVATVPPETVDFSGDEAGTGGGGISSEGFPALGRVAAAVVFDPSSSPFLVALRLSLGRS